MDFREAVQIIVLLPEIHLELDMYKDYKGKKYVCTFKYLCRTKEIGRLIVDKCIFKSL